MVAATQFVVFVCYTPAQCTRTTGGHIPEKVPGRTPSTASVRVESGTWYTMGNYTVNLMDRLGQGSFGVVYRGKEKSTGKVVAVKQIKISKDEQGKS